MLSDPTAIFVYLAVLLGAIFWLNGQPRLQPLFRVTPAVVYAYFLPALSTSLGITPTSSPAYDWMVRYLLPVSLLLLMVTVDLRAVVRLGGKALIMMLAGSVGYLRINSFPKSPNFTISTFTQDHVIPVVRTFSTDVFNTVKIRWTIFQ